jgi:NADH-quinone oxidoreductase subunit H
MRFGWRFLIPVTLAWVVVVAFIRASQLGFIAGPTFTLAGRQYPLLSFLFVVVVAAGVLLAYYLWEGRAAEVRAAREAAPPEEIDPYAGGYPVPPLPGQRLKEPTLDASDRALEKESTRG